MEGKRTINSIKLKNILSFGSEGQEIELQPLNVLIGPNASGKSNFIEVLRLMSYLPRDISKIIGDGGGISEWLWKGSEPNPLAEINTAGVIIAVKTPSADESPSIEIEFITACCVEGNLAPGIQRLDRPMICSASNAFAQLGEEN